jgi:hypothetical protein
MKSIIKLGISGLLLATGLVQSEAATTNYWVQNVNLKITGYVQSNERTVHGTLPTKQFLAFLSGVTNPALASVSSVGPTTNNYYTNLTVEVTNFWLLPTTAAPPADLPRSYTVTSNYVVTPNNGVTYYTNNVNFTNDLIVTRGDGTNVFYTFRNGVTVPTNRTAYLFPDLPADSITATWTNHGPGIVFALNGYVLTNSVGTKTNYSYAKNPDFTQQPGAKLLLVTTIIGGTNYGSRYVVRYKSGKEDVDVDVSNFMYDGSTYISVYETFYPGAPTRVYGYSEVDFNNQAGTSFSFVGYDIQVWDQPSGKGSSLNTTVLRQRKMDAQNYAGYVSGQIGNRKFNYTPIVVRGSITLSGGKLE